MAMTISIEGIPEALAAMRKGLGDLLREAALDEAPPVAKRLTEIAARFETGLREEDGGLNGVS